MTDYPKPDLTDLSLFQPQTGYLLIEQWTEEEITQGGIHIPDAKDKKLSVGWVLKCGPADAYGDHNITLNEGDTVIFCPHTPTDLEGMGDNIITLKASDILGAIKCPKKEKSDGDHD